MAERSADWLNQALRDLEQAQSSMEAERHEWACFAAHQATEKALKALYLALGQRAWGQNLNRLWAEMPGKEKLQPPPPVEFDECLRLLEADHIPARLLESAPECIPAQSFDRRQSEAVLLKASSACEWMRTALAQHHSV